ncbi:MAG: hypothetical protein EBR88_08240 [Betaproteobacteria bacterium]|nr:hypothetical protein [Betaproteobacteria bacterium]
MSNEVMTAQIAPETMERLIVGGDLSKLSPAQRVEVYMARCEAAGLDARTQPFAYLSLSGKLTLYATKAATDQLVANRKLSVQITDRKHLAGLDLYEVVARVTHPDGRICEDVGVVNMKGLSGDAAANAILKAITKAKRRAVLSACGLGMLDETETETIQGATVRPVVEIITQPEPAAEVAVAEVIESSEEDKQAEIRKAIGTAWREYSYSPAQAKAHLLEATGKDRVADLSLAEAAGYLRMLAADNTEPF